MNDDSIIELFWNRDEQAISNANKKYGKLCYHLAYNILKNDEDSEECVNDTFLKVWNSIPYDHPEHFSAYLCQIVKRIAISKFRYNSANKRKYEDYKSYDELSELVSNIEMQLNDNIINDISSSINKFLLNESKKNRMVFVRRYWYYDSVEDIAVLFNISIKTVFSILSRMRKRLKKYLEEEGYDL